MSLRIGLDCRLSGLKHAGIGRYVLNLAQRLPNLGQDVSWIYFVATQDQVTELFPKKIPSNLDFKLVPITHYSLAEQTRLPRIFSQERLDLLHVPHFNKPMFYRGQTVITIHDLLWHHHTGSQVTTLSGWKYWLKYLGYRVVSSQAIHQAHKILVPTKSVQKTVGQYYPKAEKKCVVTPEGIDQQLLAEQLPPAKNYAQAQKTKTLLYVGSLYPHKNIEIVLQFLAEHLDFRLHIAGSRSVFQDRVRQKVADLGIQSQVNFLGFVPDTQLRQLYQTSLALIQPSLSEGFGLTGLEALAAGGRVVASHLPILKEVYGEAAAYFDPHSSDSLAGAINNLQTTDPKQLRAAADQVRQKYSWETMAEQTWDVYQSVLS